jgi:basic membrane lipoprotein Med (substrate-binding protein (PBP1-ABC) superfamily)
VITSAIKRVNVAVERVARELQRGTFRAGDNVFDAANGGTGIAPPSRVVPQTVLTQVRRYQSELAQGTVIAPVTVPPK